MRLISEAETRPSSFKSKLLKAS